MEQLEPSKYSKEKFSEAQNQILSRVISQSLSKSISIPEGSFLTQISKDHYWTPPTINSWTYLPSFSKFPPEVQLRYNQLHALLINEIFCYFEQGFIKKVLAHKLKEMNPRSELGQAIQFFCEEEDKHTEMFWQLCEAAEPQLYTPRAFRFIDVTSVSARLRSFIMVNFTNQLLFWMWMAIFFEERTLLYSAEYAKCTDPRLSPQFKKVHELHMIEEARHVQMDEIFIELYFRHQPVWKHRLAHLMFKKVLTDFSVPYRSSKAMSHYLKQEFSNPEIQANIDQCVRELPTLAKNQEYRRRFFGPEAAPRTFRRMEEFSIFSNLLRAE